MSRSEDRSRALRRRHRYHRMAGYVPLGYGLICMAVNLDAGGLEARFGLLMGGSLALVGLAHLWWAGLVSRTRRAERHRPVPLAGR